MIRVNYRLTARFRISFVHVKTRRMFHEMKLIIKKLIAEHSHTKRSLHIKQLLNATQVNCAKIILKESVTYSELVKLNLYGCTKSQIYVHKWYTLHIGFRGMNLVYTKLLYYGT